LFYKLGQGYFCSAFINWATGGKFNDFSDEGTVAMIRESLKSHYLHRELGHASALELKILDFRRKIIGIKSNHNDSGVCRSEYLDLDGMIIVF
jgi:hypothetical protein